MTVEVSKGQRFATAAIELKPVSGTVLDLQINVSSTAGSPSRNRFFYSLPHSVLLAILSQVFPGDSEHDAELTVTMAMPPQVLKKSSTQLLLRGIGAGGAGLSWKISGPGLPATQNDETLPFSSNDFSPSGWKSAYFVLSLSEGLRLGWLQTGSSYTVTLSSSSAGGSSGETTLSVRLPSPPYAGECTVTPSAGAAMQTKVWISCVTWSAEDYPLSYSFAMTAHGNGVFWTPSSFTGKKHFLLQNGNYTAAARIYEPTGGLYTQVRAGSVLITDPVRQAPSLSPPINPADNDTSISSPLAKRKRQCKRGDVGTHNSC